jgi:hypothetical protein
VVGERLERSDALQSARDVALGTIRTTIGDSLDEHGSRPYRDQPLTGGEVRKYCAPRGFAALAQTWHANSPDDELTGELWAWFELDWRRWHRQERTRRRAVGYRDDLYWQIAAVLTRQCRRVVVDDTNVRELARLRTTAWSTLGNDLQRDINARRDQSAPASLRAAIKSAALREGVAIREVSALGLSRTHTRCGHINPVEHYSGPTPLLCLGCGQMYDPDASATGLMLREVGGA